MSECSLLLGRTQSWVTPLFARSLAGKGQPVHGAHIKQAQAGAQASHVAGTSKMPLEIPRMLLATHETSTTGGRWAGNQRIKARVLKHVNSRNHRTATLTLENGIVLLGPTAGQMLRLERQ